MRFSKKNGIWFSFALSMLEKNKHEGENTKKESYNKKQIFFVTKVGCANKGVCFVWKLQNPICVWKGKKGIFVKTICFGKKILSCFFGEKQKTIRKYGGVQQAEGKAQTSPLSQRCFGRGLWKAVYYLWSKKAVFCWKHYCLVFSAKHSFCKLHETEINQKQWVVFQHARRCFFFVWVFYCMFGLGRLVVWCWCMYGLVVLFVF